MNANEIIEIAKFLGMTEIDEMSFGPSFIYFIEYNLGEEPIAKIIQSGNGLECCLAFCEGDEVDYLFNNFR